MSNKPMLRTFERLPYVIHKKLEDGVVSLHFRFDEPKEVEPGLPPSQPAERA